MPVLALIVYSCLATTNFSDFDPHQIGAARTFVVSHPDTCSTSMPIEVDDEASIEECQTQGFLHVLPQWQLMHPERVYFGASCYEPARSEIQAYLHNMVPN